MNVWDKCNKKTCVNFIADNYRHLFSMPKKELRKFLECYPLTQLKDNIEEKHKKRSEKIIGAAIL